MPGFTLQVDSFAPYVGNMEIDPPKQYYRHKQDREILKRLRACASTNVSEYTNGCPAVWVLNDPLRKTEITKYWQFYIDRVINYRMPAGHALRELGYKRALANGTGYGKPGMNRANWITGSNLTAPNPLFDKDRTMSNSMLSAVDDREYYEPILFKDPATDTRRIFQSYIIVRTFDGNKPPPMKPGKRQPETLSQVKAEDYLHHPSNPNDWDLFFALNIVNLSGDLVPFAGGATYDWFFSGRDPVCFYPHISTGQIKYPLEFLEKLPLGTNRIRPYTK